MAPNDRPRISQFWLHPPQREPEVLPTSPVERDPFRREKTVYYYAIEWTYQAPLGVLTLTGPNRDKVVRFRTPSERSLWVAAGNTDPAKPNQREALPASHEKVKAAKDAVARGHYDWTEVDEDDL